MTSGGHSADAPAPRSPDELQRWSREHRLPLIDRGGGCDHLARLERPAEPRAEACEECGSTHSLRVCLGCGHVGCCDSQRGHARIHANESGHRLIRAWKGGAFVYCFEDGYL